MKKITIFTIVCFLLILLISCGNSTSNTSCETTQQISKPTPSVSTTQPSSAPSPSVSTTQQGTSKAPITSTVTPMQTQPTSTSETVETDPTVIKAGFGPFGLTACPLFVAYEMPKSFPLSENTVSITLYFDLNQSFLLDENASVDDYYEIDLRTHDNQILFHFRTVTVEDEDLYYHRHFTYSETYELPRSLFSRYSENLILYVEYFSKVGPNGSNSALLSYKVVNDETIVFYPRHFSENYKN